VIDGFLADRVAAATTAWRRNAGARIEEHPLRFSTDVRFMLSRASETPQMLSRLNGAIDQLRSSGELRRIADYYALPVLINQTIDSGWFRILGFMGLVAFALSGVILAYEGQYSVFGAVMLAVLPAVGGGVARDLLLQREAIGIVRNPEAILIVFATVFAHSGRPCNQIFKITRAYRHANDRSVRRRRACRLHRRWRRRRFGHIGAAVPVMGSNRRSHHRFIWRLDTRCIPARSRQRQLARRALS